MPVESRLSHGREVVLLWISVLIGPVTALALELVNFVVVPWACAISAKWPLYLVNIAALLVVLVGALLAFRIWREAGREWPGESDGVMPRSRFLAAGALLLNAFSVLFVVTHGVPNLVLGVCQ